MYEDWLDLEIGHKLNLDSVTHYLHVGHISFLDF